MELIGNRFINNEASRGDGGAIMYMCNPYDPEIFLKTKYNCTVALLGNHFEGNTADG